MCVTQIKVNLCNKRFPDSLTKEVEVDTCIADIVQALNNAGIDTVGSCCGHGKKPGVIHLYGRSLYIKLVDDEMVYEI